MTKNQKIIIVSIIVAALLIIAMAWLWHSRQNAAPAGQSVPVATSTGPQFLTTDEKAQLGIAVDSPIQVFRVGDDVTYKIIKQDSDIVTNTAAVVPISPVRRDTRQKLPAAK
jgi:hypothetical protein